MPVSIDTNNADRNAHLLRADFDVQNNSDITISGTELIKLDNYNYRLTGVPKMKWINKEVMLDVEFVGYIKDPYGNEKAGFSFNGRFNRKDRGLNWNAALETGGVMVSEEVPINGEVQFVKQP